MFTILRPVHPDVAMPARRQLYNAAPMPQGGRANRTLTNRRAVRRRVYARRPKRGADGRGAGANTSARGRRRELSTVEME